jgi:hypothetical protein
MYVWFNHDPKSVNGWMSAAETNRTNVPISQVDLIDSAGGVKLCTACTTLAWHRKWHPAAHGAPCPLDHPANAIFLKSWLFSPKINQASSKWETA